jgi:hypothetical protein
MKTQEQSILASRYKSVEIEVFVRVNSIAKHLCCSRPNPACHVTLVRRVRSSFRNICIRATRGVRL